MVVANSSHMTLSILIVWGLYSYFPCQINYKNNLRTTYYFSNFLLDE
jgi:hypothetical protein